MLKALDLGQLVYWTDPEGISSGIYKIANLYSKNKNQMKICNLHLDHMVLISNDYSETIVFVSELSQSVPTI